MAKVINKLREKAKNPDHDPHKITRVGLHHDGEGLYLKVTPTGTKSWVFRYQLDGQERRMGLGTWPAVGLAEARRLADDARRKLRGHRAGEADSTDPLEARRATQQARRAAKLAAAPMTFQKAAEHCITAKESGWKNPKLAALWRSTLATYAEPLIGGLPVAAIDTDHVRQVLAPIWTAKPETASRVRMRVAAVLDWAKASKLRAGDNPAADIATLKHLLGEQGKKVEHHPALAYKDMPTFMAGLRKREGVSARALETLILTAARTNEVLGMKWTEVDLKGKLWIVPAERMKGQKGKEREHRVALSERAVEVLKEMEKTRAGEIVFPSANPNRPMSNMVFLQLLKRMDRSDLTAHGFRSTFRDWCAEQTAFPGEVAEMALAHIVSDKVEAAYRRGDLLEKRFALAQQWADFCEGAQHGEDAR